MAFSPLQRIFSLAISLFILTIFAATWWAQNVALEMNEKACRLNFGETQVSATLALKNNTSRLVAANIKLELIDQDNRLRYRTEKIEQIKSGASALTLDLTQVELKSQDLSDDKIWWRLRYVIIFENEDVSTPLEGIISASEITPDIFDLEIFAPDEAEAGTRYQARTRASHPITKKPVNGVKIDATSEIEIDDKEVIIKASGVTNADGYAVLNFDIPKDLGGDNSSIEINFTAQKGILKQEVETDVRLIQYDNFILTTDKPIYQPGQILHTRILLFDTNKKAKAESEINIRIEDPENQIIFRSTLKTSKFGVANVDWQMPENTRLGNYSVIVGAESHTKTGEIVKFKISRYDLPTFVVNTTPNQGYYLPGQNAEVEIKADYLFGQPVAKGKVKVVRESERRWNYKEQKYEVEESEKYEGETDSSGKFTAKITLDNHHEDLQEKSYRQFEDVHYAAYFTDATTGRTEQRRFDLRVTKEPIHIYILYHVDQGKGLPLELFVHASYADGAPVQCEIAVSESIKLGGKKIAVTPLTTINTNQYGVARISDLMLSDRQYADKNFELKFEARDRGNNIGQQTTHIHWPDHPIIRINTDKALYRIGEAIKVHLKSNLKDSRIFFEILQGGKVSTSQALDLKQGQANLVLPYKSDYKDEITLIAYANDLNEEDEESSFVNTSHTVLYPRDRELKLDVKLPRNDYQPGEEVRADLSIRMPDGRAAESVIGATIVDTAVAERARTDSEFSGGGNRSYYNYYYGRDNLAGFTRRDLDKLDTRQPIPTGIDIVAEILLRNSSQGIHRFGRSDYAKDQHEIFAEYFKSQFRMMRSWLETEYNGKSIYPKDIATLKRILRPYGLDPEELRDPWGTTYHFGFLPEQDRDKLMLLSAGADKVFDTRDDFVVLDIERFYFKFTGEAINRAITNYQARTGDYIRDAGALKTELKREGIDFDALRDPWGTAYQISFRKNWNGFQLLVKSAGKDKIFSSSNLYSHDDAGVWSTPIDYTSEMRSLINQALDNHIKATKLFPATEFKFRELLQKAGIDFDGFRDPLGHKYYATVINYSEYSSVVENINYAKFGEKAQNKMEIVPITQTVIAITIRGVGEDDMQGTVDDIEVARFTRIIAEQSTRNGVTEKIEVAGNQVKVIDQKTRGIEAPLGFGGSVSGVVTDASGAAVSSVKVIASSKSTNGIYESVTNGEGFYVLKNLPAGLYGLRFEAQGFKVSIRTGITVVSSNITQVNLTLEIGGVSETVNITAEAVTMQTESSQSMATTVSSKKILELPGKGLSVSQLLALQPGVSKQPDISTPRLREYFPETLLWQPNIETDKQGRAQLKFKLADNITTWKLSLIGSTVDGQIGTVEKDIRAFQPFFAELDPPKILTEGDEISLPVVLRNYLDKTQSVDVQFKPESWFTMLSPARKKSEVKANDSTNEIFSFKAISSINKGKQRVTAIASAASDAIEKTVNVHPDGEEIAETAAGVFNETGTLEINLPKESIAGSARGELKIYPNLLAHVTEGIEGILQRPHGCGEQTISSTYPNVMALRLLKSSGIEKHAIEKTALKYTQAGYDRLLGYRDASGGFTYWGKGEPDLALTAYALRFLNDADGVIDVKAT